MQMLHPVDLDEHRLNTAVDEVKELIPRASQLSEYVTGILAPLRKALNRIEQDEIGPLRDEITLREQMIQEAINHLDSTANKYGMRMATLITDSIAKLREELNKMPSPEPSISLMSVNPPEIHSDQDGHH